MGDLGLAEISKNYLENLHTIDWREITLAAKPSMRLCLQSAPFGSSISVQGKQIQDGLLATVPQDNLEMIRTLRLEGINLSDRGLVSILEKLNSNFDALVINSTRLTPHGVDAFIHAMPASVGYLSIRGIAIGEHGKEKFRQKVKEQEARTGVAIELDE